MSAHVASRLSAFLDRELTEGEAKEVRQHVADCEACAGRLRELEGVDRVFAEMPADPPAGYFDSFAARVRGRIETAPSLRPGTARWPGLLRLPAWSWAVAAALLLAVLLPRLPWDGGRPRSRAEREGTAAAPPAAQTAAGERFARAPASPAPPAVTERADLALRRGAEASKAAPSVARSPAADSADAKVRDAFAVSGLEETAAAPSLPARTPEAPKPQTRKKDVEQDLASQIGNEARQAPRAEARLQPREVGFADAPAALAAEAAPAEALSKSEAEASAPVPAGLAAGTVATGRVEEGKRQKAAGSGKEARVAGVDAAGAYADPGVEAQFQALSARRPGSIPEQRRLREAWRSFLSRDPDGPHADEARVAVITASVEIAVQSRDAADEAQARRDAASYLARPDAAQKSRVQSLLLRLGGSR